MEESSQPRLYHIIIDNVAELSHNFLYDDKLAIVF